MARPELRLKNVTEGGTNDRLIDVTRADGEVGEVRVLDGQVFVCKACCCGNGERGFPEVPLEEFKSQWKARGIRRRVHLTISGCLGPCAVANVVLLILYGRVVWLHSIDSPQQVTAIYDHVERSLATGECLPLDESLAACEFDRFSFEPLAEAGGCTVQIGALRNGQI